MMILVAELLGNLEVKIMAAKKGKMVKGSPVKIKGALSIYGAAAFREQLLEGLENSFQILFFNTNTGILNKNSDQIPI